MKRRLVCVFMIIGIVSCAKVPVPSRPAAHLQQKVTDEEPWATDPWFRPVPELTWDWEEILKERISPVPSVSQAEAIRLLTDAPVVELSDKDVKTFAPMLQSQPVGLKPYLIRGVFMQGPDGKPMGTGHFFTHHRGKDVLVEFGCLGRKSWGMRKGPLVIWLPFKPEEVFVTCGMDE